MQNIAYISIGMILGWLLALTAPSAPDTRAERRSPVLEVLEAYHANQKADYLRKMKERDREILKSYLGNDVAEFRQPVYSGLFSSGNANLSAEILKLYGEQRGYERAIFPPGD